MKYKIIAGIGVVVAILVVVAVAELIFVKYNGQNVPAPNIPRTPETYGANASPRLNYVVMGDSTAVAQGGNYDQGYARATAKHLANGHRVTLRNIGVSGARTDDVATKQLPEAVKLKPDVVLIAVGANDVTHGTRIGDVRRSLETTIDGLRAANPEVKIVLTGAAQIGSVPRFPQPISYLAGYRTDRINTMVAAVTVDKQVTFAHIADETGPTFAQHPELFAADKFHPTTEGYKLWTPVINRALDSALGA